MKTVDIIFMVIEYTTSAAHTKTCMNRNGEKDIKHYRKKHTHIKHYRL